MLLGCSECWALFQQDVYACLSFQFMFSTPMKSQYKYFHHIFDIEVRWKYQNEAPWLSLILTFMWYLFEISFRDIFLRYHHSLYPAAKLGGLYWIHPVCPSVCPLTFRVRPVASTVQDGFFPCLVLMITSMRGCVTCDDLWPWPISSRSFRLDLENRVRSVASPVLDGFFLYLAQMITIIRGCVACYVYFRNWKFEILAIF